MLRYVLASSEQGLVPLGEELAFVDDYLAIERARFGKRLHVAREVDPKALLDAPVPSLILQPLVENAIRHGRGNDGSIDLIIRVRSDGNAVTIAPGEAGDTIELSASAVISSTDGARTLLSDTGTNYNIIGSV